MTTWTHALAFFAGIGILPLISSMKSLRRATSEKPKIDRPSTVEEATERMQGLYEKTQVDDPVLKEMLLGIGREHAAKEWSALGGRRTP